MMKNKVVEINDNIVAIEIVYKGTVLYCYIDKEDLPKVSSIKGTWHITYNRNHIDGVRTKIQKNGIRIQVWIHNIIMEKKNPSNVIDHIDHNPLNNVKSNLREITIKENNQNISTTSLKSRAGIRNITIERGRYRVRIGGHSFGSYNTLEEAQVVATDKRKIIFPISSELDNKISI